MGHTLCPESKRLLHGTSSSGLLLTTYSATRYVDVLEQIIILVHFFSHL